MKKNFLAGLAILLPFVVTLWFVLFVLNWTTKPFAGAIEQILIQLQIAAPVIHSYKAIIQIVSQIIAALMLAVVLFFTGFAAQAVVVKYFIRFGNSILHKIPLINKIYKASQDVMHTLFSEEGKAFSHVVLVPFPDDNSLSIGFISKSIEECDEQDQISVFVPATPNPTIGFLLLFSKKQLIFVDLTVEEALKFVVSCGVVFPEFKKEVKESPDNLE
jgi:uncharacterized membrane protein